MPEPIIPPQPAAPQAQRDVASSSGAGATKTVSGTGVAQDVKALQGRTTADDKVSIEAEILTYDAISRIALKIKTEFDQRFPKKSPDNQYWIIVLDDSVAAAVVMHQAFVMELDLIADGFRRVIDANMPMVAPEKAVLEVQLPRVAMFAGAPALGLIGGLSAAATLGRSVIDVLSLFRQDTSYYGRSYTVKDTALTFEVIRTLRAEREDVHCLYPKLLLYRPGSVSQKSHDQLKVRLQSVYDVRDQAERVVGELSQACLELESKIHPSAPHSRPEHALLTKLTTELIEKRVRLDSCQKLFAGNASKLGETVSALSMPDPKGVTPLEIIQKAEEILDRFQEPNTQTMFLYLDAVAAGGSYRVRSNLWRTLFNSDGLSYSGGAIITYAFFNDDAEVVLCGMHRWRTPFTRFQDQIGAEGKENSF